MFNLPRLPQRAQRVKTKIVITKLKDTTTEAQRRCALHRVKTKKLIIVCFMLFSFNSVDEEESKQRFAVWWSAWCIFLV